MTWKARLPDQQTDWEAILICTQKPSKAPRVQNSMNDSIPKVNEKLKTHEAPHTEDWETDLSPAAPARPPRWTPQAPSPVSEPPLHSAQSTRRETQVPRGGLTAARAPRPGTPCLLHPSRRLPSEHWLRDHSLIEFPAGTLRTRLSSKDLSHPPQDSNTPPPCGPLPDVLLYPLQYVSLHTQGETKRK